MWYLTISTVTDYKSMDFYCFMQKKGTPAMNPKSGSQVKIGRKPEHSATETGVTEI